MSETKRVKSSIPVADELVLEMTTDYIDCQHLDTECNLDGFFWIAGPKRDEFAKKLESLIVEYRI